MNFVLLLAPVAILITFAVIGLAIAKAKKGSAQTGPRFRKLPALLSPAEQTFFVALEQAMPTTRIFPKVRVADVIGANDRKSGDFSRISQKHFDFVLCEPTTFEPLAAIELDDSTHNGTRQRKNDATKDTAGEDAGLPIIRFRCRPQYEAEEIRERISAKVSTTSGKPYAA